MADFLKEISTKLLFEVLYTLSTSSKSFILIYFYVLKSTMNFVLSIVSSAYRFEHVSIDMCAYL